MTSDRQTSPTPDGPDADSGRFRTTRWSIVASAGGDSGEARAALDELCRAYWYPLYALARRQGLPAAGAEDAVQGFFADLLQRGDLTRVDRARGRFRAFLATAFRNYQSNARDRDRALKRGGGRAPLSLEDAEQRYAEASGRALGPEALYDRAWALAMLDVAMTSLRRSYVERGQEARFDALRVCLTGDAEPESRAALAERLGLTEGALKVAIHRLRARYRDALVGAVRDTVDSDDAVEAELGALFHALGG